VFPCLAGADIDSREIEKRKKAMAMIKIDNKITIETDLKDIEEKQTGDSVKGTAVYHGKIQGTAKIITDPKQEVNENDILIMDMSNPNLIPLISKAKGMITDRGGTICHAAIVARELRKPCITGTENATRVFQDGDHIVLDTKKGTAYKNKEMNRWNYLGRWVQPTISVAFWHTWAQDDFMDHVGLPRCNGDTIQLDGFHWFLKKDMGGVYNATKKAAERTDKKFFDRFNKRCNSIKQEVMNDVEQLKQLGKGNTAQEMKFFIDSFSKIFPPWVGVFPMGDGVEAVVKELADKEGISMEDVSSLIKIPEETAITAQKKEAHNLYREIKKAVKSKDTEKIIDALKKEFPDLYTLVKEHIEEFEYLGVHHFAGEPLTEKRFMQEMNKPFNPESSKTPDVKVSKRLQWLIKISGMLAYQRLHMAELSGIMTHYSKALFENIDKELDLAPGDFVWLSFKEIMDHLNSNAKSSIDLEQRKNGVGMLTGNDKEKVIADKEMNDMIDKMFPDRKKDVDTIKGRVASRGKAQGRVRLLIAPEDAKKLKKGEILVAPETTPEFVPAMEKAAAVVTDRGGLTSHAAIVSRELGVPCIIGTDIATHALKDGDLVEVDAEKGIIRKIK